MKDIQRSPQSPVLTVPPLRVARIPYLNTFPFSGGDAAEGAPAFTVPPRRAGLLAGEGKVDAALLPVVDCWAREDRFMPLANLGIAVRGPAKSVLLFSRDPLAQLGNAPLGVTDQSSTSVRLLRLLLRERYRLQPWFREGFREDDRARLLIGDDALVSARSGEFPHVVDLGEEWRSWQGLPFVFARWVIRRDVPPAERERFRKVLEGSLESFEEGSLRPSESQARAAGLSAAEALEYLAAFTYRLGDAEIRGEKEFRKLAETV